MKTLAAANWAMLDDHFREHAKQVHRFSNAGREALVRMWKSQRNESGEPLSHFERQALVERHCEVFGTWPSQ